MSLASVVRAAGQVLEWAADAQLPEPDMATTYPWSTAVHLSFREVGDLAEWARYTDSHIAERETDSGAVHYTIGASDEVVTAFDMPIQAWCIVTAAKRAEQSA